MPRELYIDSPEEARLFLNEPDCQPDMSAWHCKRSAILQQSEGEVLQSMLPDAVKLEGGTYKTVTADDGFCSIYCRQHGRCSLQDTFVPVECETYVVPSDFTHLPPEERPNEHELGFVRRELKKRHPKYDHPAGRALAFVG